jgi:hypothetical protein
VAGEKADNFRGKQCDPLHCATRSDRPAVRAAVDTFYLSALASVRPTTSALRTPSMSSKTVTGVGCCYHPVATVTATAVVTAAVVGSIVHSVPPSCTSVVVNGLAYHVPQYLVPAPILGNDDNLCRSESTKVIGHSTQRSTDCEPSDLCQGNEFQGNRIGISEATSIFAICQNKSLPRQRTE